MYILLFLYHRFHIRLIYIQTISFQQSAIPTLPCTFISPLSSDGFAGYDNYFPVSLLLHVPDYSFLLARIHSLFPDFLFIFHSEAAPNSASEWKAKIQTNEYEK